MMPCGVATDDECAIHDGVLGPIRRLEASATEPRPRSTFSRQKARDGIGNRRYSQWSPQPRRELSRLEPQWAKGRHLEASVGWHYLDSKEALAFFRVLSSSGGIVELSHWLLTPVRIDLKSDFVVLELAVEWTATVIRQLADSGLSLHLSKGLNDLGLHFA
jgi:hypothetical protein